MGYLNELHLCNIEKKGVSSSNDLDMISINIEDYKIGIIPR